MKRLFSVQGHEVSLVWFEMSALSQIPQRYKDCVFGYVKNVQKLLPWNNVYYNIPPAVTFLILEYYYIKEAFGIHGDGIKLDKTSMIATRCSRWEDNCVFGTVLIDFDKDFIYKWELKMLSSDDQLPLNTFGHVAIGIVATEYVDLCKNTIFTGYYCNNDFVAYHNRIYNTFQIEWMKYAENSGKSYCVNDTIKMEINTKNKTIEFSKNDKSFGVLYRDRYGRNVYIVDSSRKYRLAVFMGKGRSMIQLVNFDQIAID